MYPQHDWMNQAACAGQPTEVFFPETIGITNERIYDKAKTFCNECNVRYECLVMAMQLETPDIRRHGVWGGLSPEERDAL